ncbi:MAG: hypothetical protein MK180_00430 [Rhodobacteraceae bacterium]|nr:hypothetical protein [Paracoccaceae bacterium]
MRILICLPFVLLAGCGQLPAVFQPGPPPVVEPAAPELVLEEEGAEIEEAVAEPVPAASRETLVTLGNAAEPGLWVKTPLVSTQGQGRVTAVESGRSIEVTLIPIDGPATAGSRASLAALQALGLPLTAVSPLRIDTL